ncbi:hypothetical protein PG984_009990 [Apiospora sp. TS-2023a]
MTPGTGAPPPQFTPEPGCEESMSHLYRTSAYTDKTPDPAVCTPLSNLRYHMTCDFYNLGPIKITEWGGQFRDRCTPNIYATRRDETVPSYSGCPSGYTTACSGTALSGYATGPSWLSTAISAMCCPTHSVFSFSCGGPSSTDTKSLWTYDVRLLSVDGCVAAVPSLTTTEVLSITTVGTATLRVSSPYLYGSETVPVGAETGFSFILSTATSTATLQPGIDHVSAPGVGISMLAWGRSTCYAERDYCETPPPMWEWKTRHWGQKEKPWGPAGASSSNAMGIASIVLLCIISIAFVMSVLGFWAKSKEMQARRRQLRLDLHGNAQIMPQVEWA